MRQAVRVAAGWWKVLVWGLLVLPALYGVAAGKPVVRKVAETFDEAPWPPDGWNRAVGVTTLAADVPPS